MPVSPEKRQALNSVRSHVIRMREVPRGVRSTDAFRCVCGHVARKLLGGAADGDMALLAEGEAPTWLTSERVEAVWSGVEVEAAAPRPNVVTSVQPDSGRLTSRVFDVYVHENNGRLVAKVAACRLAGKHSLRSRVRRLAAKEFKKLSEEKFRRYLALVRAGRQRVRAPNGQFQHVPP